MLHLSRRWLQSHLFTPHTLVGRLKTIGRSFGNTTAPTSNTPARHAVRIGGIRSDGTTGRWYKTVDVASDGHGKYIVLIDRRPMKSFKEYDVVVPTERLAYAIASEWMMQDSFMKPTALPLTRIVSGAFDIMSEHRDTVIPAMMTAMEHDSICLRYGGTSVVNEYYDQTLLPINGWFTENFGIPLTVSYDFGHQVKHHPELIQKVKNYLAYLDDMHLAALEQLTLVSKSMGLSLAVCHGAITIEECVKTARAEEELQMVKWGEVAGSHDLDRSDVAVKLASAALFWRLLLPQPPVKQDKV